MERSAFLRRVRDSIGRLPEAPDSDPGLLVPALPEVDLVERFERALTAVDGELHRGDPVAILRELVERHGAGPVLAWDASELPVPDVLGVLDRTGCTRMASSSGDSRPEYARVHLGITGAEAAFAESGSVVVRSGPGRPRMASLIPLVHVVLLERGRIHRSLAHWAAVSAASMAASANVVFVTGPSRTADIEQQLSLGVHGPRYLHVVLVEPRREDPPPHP